MSVSSLANAAAARRPDIGPVNDVPRSMSEIAAAAATPPDKAPSSKQEATPANTALNLLIGYVPTEIVTLYVALTTAIQPANAPGAASTTAEGAARTAETAKAAAALLDTQWIVFWCFLAATPLTVWVVYATKLKAAGKPLPTTWASLPVWEMTAALLSFAAWAFALPNAPFSRYPWYSPPIAGFVVLLASTVLGLLAPLFQNPLGTGTQSTPGTGTQVAPGTGQQNSLDSGQDKPSERTTPAGG